MLGIHTAHRNSISQEGNILIKQITNDWKLPETEKLIFVVKSLQSTILQENECTIVSWKKKRRGKLDIDKLRKKIYSSTK